MRRGTLAAAIVTATLASMLALAAPVSAGTIVVAPGESIQDAVSAALPGDTIQLEAGVYEDVVVIKTNDITIQGAGSGTDGSILRPPAELPRRCFGGAAGICVFGDFHAGTPVSGVTVTGVRTEGYLDSGFLAVLAENTTFGSDAGVDADEYGLAAFQSTGTVFQDNVATGNGLAGIYVGDSLHANATISGNELSGNTWGMFLRDSAHGDVTGNTIHDNCIGILNLDTPEPVRAGHYTISGNTIEHNSEFCRGGGPNDPDTSGIGIAIVGGLGNTVQGNTIEANRASRHPAFHGGIVLIAMDTAPKNNTVTGNTLVSNRPNVFWDGSGSGNVVEDNVCTPAC